MFYTKLQKNAEKTVYSAKRPVGRKANAWVLSEGGTAAALHHATLIAKAELSSSLLLCTVSKAIDHVFGAWRTFPKLGLRVPTTSDQPPTLCSPHRRLYVQQ